MAGVGRRRFKRALEESLGKKQEKLKLIPALLGAYFNAQKTITVAGRPDFVWCRVRGSTSEVVQAFNETVALHYDLPILIYRDPNAPDIYKVYGRDIRQYDDWGGISFGLPPHGHSHSFGGGQGSDPVWIYKRQYLPMLPRPVSTGSMDIWIEPEFWYFGGQYHWWPGSGTTDLSGYKPTGSVNGRYVTVYIDGNSGIPQYLLGDEFNLIYTPRDPGDYIPLPNSAQGVPIAAVFLMTGTERIGWGEIYDLRQPEIPLPSTGSALQVYDTHISEGQFGGIDFLEQLDVKATGTTAYVNVAPPVSGSFVVFDEGNLLGSALGLNVIGAAGQIVISGAYAHLMLTGTADPAVTGSITVYDEGVLLGQANAINVVGDEVQAVMSGTTAHFLHTGTATKRTWGSWSIHYAFRTGTYGSGEITFNNYTGSMVTQMSCNGTDAEGASATLRILGIASAELLRIMVWSEFDPSTWWAGNVVSAQQLNGDILLDVAYIDSNGGDQPFEEGESVLLTAGFLPTPTGTVVIYDEGTFLGNFKEMRFIGAGVTALHSGSYAAIAITGSALDADDFTYSRSGMLVALAGETGVYWQVPDQSYATGSVAIMVNGIWQRPVTDFTEQYAVSGTILLGEAPITGSVLAATWGVAA